MSNPFITPESAVPARTRVADPDDVGSLLLSRAGRVEARQLVEVAARLMPHSHHCAISLARHDRRPRTIASTGDLPTNVDALQYETDEGPCLDAVGGDEVVVSDDLSSDARWPDFAPRCAEELGVRSMLSIRLFLTPDDRAALNFYSRHARAFDDVDVGTGSVLAPYATLVVEQELHVRDVANLENALASSRQIGTAVGILMASHRIREEEAFRRLSLASQQSHRKLREVALDVVDTGALPERGR